MKAVVIHDSLYGNTKKIARAIGDGLVAALGDDESVAVIPVGEFQMDRFTAWNLLVVGAPTHGSRPSPPMHEFLARIPNNALASMKVTAFDTRTDMKKLTGWVRLFGGLMNRMGYAAPKIATSLDKKGAQMISPPEGFIVLDTEGPLREGELERAAGWSRQIAA